MEEGSDAKAHHKISFGGQSGLRKRKIILIVVAVLVVVAIAVALLAYFLTRKSNKDEGGNINKKEESLEEVELLSGVVRGRQEGQALVFKGIPYAKSPDGKRHWKPPVPCAKDTCWNGTFDADQFGNICAQQDLFATTGDAENVIGSEDCLFVNVWTPKERPKDKLFPVLVFIHGGFLLYLSGNWKGFHPTPEMVVDMDIVGVSFNHRLNAFGFLALRSLADNSTNKHRVSMDSWITLRHLAATRNL